MKRVFFVSLVAIFLLFLLIGCVPQKPTNNSGGSQVTKKDIYNWKLSILSSTNPDSGIPVSEIEGKVLRVIPTSTGSNAIISDATTSIFVYKANINQSDVGKKMVIKNSVGKTYQQSLEIDLTTGQKELSDDNTQLNAALLNVALSSSASKETRALWDIRYAKVFGYFTGKLGSITNTYEFQYKTSEGETATILVYKKDDIDNVYTPTTTTAATLTGYTKYYNGTWEFVVFPEEIEIELPQVNNVNASYNPNTKILTINWESDVQNAVFEVVLYGEEEIISKESFLEKTAKFSVDNLEAVKSVGITAVKSKSKSKEKVIQNSEISVVTISLVSNLGAKYDDFNRKMYITWQWDSATELPEEYVIYRKSSGIYEKIGTSSTNSFEYEENNYEQLEGYAVAAIVKGEEGPKKDIDKASIKYTFAGGDGSESNPFLIGTPNQLKLLEEYKTMNKYFKLISNIDLSGISWTPVGNYSSDLTQSAFQGTFDGNGYKIKNLNYEDTSRQNAGLFGYLYNSTIKNLILENCSVKASAYVGTLSGAAKKSTIYRVGVRNSTVIGTSSSTNPYSAGLIGDISGGVLIEESFASNITVEAPNNDNARSGGLIGRAMHSTDGNNELKKCYATGILKFKSNTSSNIGGLIGLTSSATGSPNNNIINQSYAAVAPYNIATSGDVGSNTNWKGFVGGGTVVALDPTVMNYFDTGVSATASGSAKSTLQTGLTTDQMKQKTSFSGWDFDNVWSINDGVDYPRLKWETN